MAAGSSLVFLGLALAGGAFGGAATLRRLGEPVPSCALMGIAGAVTLTFGVLAVLPSPPMPVGSTLPLIAATAALGVGWTTDAASMRLPHTTANTMLAVVAWASAEGWQQTAGAPMPSAGAVIAAALAPVVAGMAFKPPSTRTVWIWHLGGGAALAGFALAAVLGAPDGPRPGDGPLAALGVTLAALGGGRLLAWTGRAGAGDPVWVAAGVMAAASHASMSSGVPLQGLEALAPAALGASVFLTFGGAAALLLAAVSAARGREPLSRQPVLAGQWAALGLIGFAVAWKLTPLGWAAAA